MIEKVNVRESIRTAPADLGELKNISRPDVGPTWGFRQTDSGVEGVNPDLLHLLGSFP